MRSFIFPCSRETKQECLKRNLFGTKREQLEWVRDIRPGDILFLYDYSTSMLIGVFEATSEGKSNIVPEAWNGKYPAQVKVKQKSGEIKELPRVKIDGIVNFSVRWPEKRLSSRQTTGLLRKFEETGKQTKGFIFWCTDSTEQECLEKKLFGGQNRHKEIIEKLEPSDTIFLYNLSTLYLHGPFEALKKGYNLVEDAWGGEFPYQVKVKPTLDKFYSLQRSEIEEIVDFSDRYPKVELLADQVSKLVSLLHLSERVSEDKEDFRKKFPANYRCDDGHYVRSRGEEMIDNWLYNQYIPHAYERRLPIPDETVYCDFLVHTKEGDCYIEYLGLEDDAYRRRTERKKSIYSAKELNMIEITNKDLEKLDDVLLRKLGRFLSGLKFR